MANLPHLLTQSKATDPTPLVQHLIEQFSYKPAQWILTETEDRLIHPKVYLQLIDPALPEIEDLTTLRFAIEKAEQDYIEVRLDTNNPSFQFVFDHVLAWAGEGYTIGKILK